MVTGSEGRRTLVRVMAAAAAAAAAAGTHGAGLGSTCRTTLPMCTELGSTRPGLVFVRFDLVWFGLVGYGLVWFGLVWFGLVWFRSVWFGLVLVWFCLAWFGLVSVWFDLKGRGSRGYVQRAFRCTFPVFMKPGSRQLF